MSTVLALILSASVISVSPDDGEELFRAQEEAREAGRGSVVELDEGVYRLGRTIRFDARDSGITYRARSGAKVIVSGAFEVTGLHRPTIEELSPRIPAQCRDQVLVADVKAAGFKAFEPFSPYGFRVKDAKYRVTQLYHDGKPLVRARHPDSGFLTVKKLVSRAKCILKTDDPIIERLAGEEELIAHGYWWNTWADQAFVVKSVDGAAKTFTMPPETDIGWVPNYFDGMCKFFFDNALAALDAPGEWYLERSTGRLFVIPEKGNGSGSWQLSELSDPMFAIEGANDVRIESIVFEGGRNHAVVVSNSTGFVFRDCTVRNFGGNGLSLFAVRDSLVSGCRFHTFGHASMVVNAGNRVTLESAHLKITDCEFSDTGRAQRTYQPGVRLSGCGVEIAHSRFHDLPSSAITITGNDHLFASNICERCVLESDDQGMTDTFGNPMFAGNRFLYNIFRDVGPKTGGKHWGRSAIRFDDAISEMIVLGNRFENCAQGGFGAVQMNGGRLNLIANNLFIGCSNGVSFTHWTMEHWREWLTDKRWRWYLEVEKASMPPYLYRYPMMRDIYNTVQSNQVERNIFVGSTRMFIGEGPTAEKGPDGVLLPPKETGTKLNIMVDHVPVGAELKKLAPWFGPLPPESALGPRR